MNGGGGCWLNVLRATPETSPSRPSQAALTSSAACLVGTVGIEEYLALKAISPLPNAPLHRPIGVGTNVPTSTSFSTTKFSVGPCTRPMLTVLIAVARPQGLGEGPREVDAPEEIDGVPQPPSPGEPVGGAQPFIAERRPRPPPWSARRTWPAAPRPPSHQHAYLSMLKPIVSPSMSKSHAFTKRGCSFGEASDGSNPARDLASRLCRGRLREGTTPGRAPGRPSCPSPCQTSRRGAQWRRRRRTSSRARPRAEKPGRLLP